MCYIFRSSTIHSFFTWHLCSFSFLAHHSYPAHSVTLSPSFDSLQQYFFLPFHHHPYLYILSRKKKTTLSSQTQIIKKIPKHTQSTDCSTTPSDPPWIPWISCYFMFHVGYRKIVPIYFRTCICSLYHLSCVFGKYVIF